MYFKKSLIIDLIMEYYAEYSQTDVFECFTCNKKILIGNIRITGKHDNQKHMKNVNIIINLYKILLKIFNL